MRLCILKRAMLILNFPVFAKIIFNNRFFMGDKQ